MLVAEITRDHLNEKYNNSFTEPLVGKQFEFEAMLDWWDWSGGQETISVPDIKTKFKLFDDDDELYYSGWLLNDDECIVQQFVLAWAQADSGCTTIKILNKGSYIQEIG